MVRQTSRTGALLALSLAAGCGEPAISDGSWVADTTHLGDTTVVRTISGCTWERPARIVEELRLGTVEGGEVTSFGEIRHVAVAEDGSMFLFDSHVPQLYRFDADGELIGRIGRQGGGPGEYTSDVTGLLVSADRLIVADADNRRLSAFSLEGNYEGAFGTVSGTSSP
jgi:hypothetical protein